MIGLVLFYDVVFLIPALCGAKDATLDTGPYSTFQYEGRMRKRLFFYTAVWFPVVFLFLSPEGNARPPAEVQPAKWRSYAPTVKQSGNEWIITGHKNQVRINVPDLGMTVKTPGDRWVMRPSADDDLTVRDDTLLVSLRLVDAGKIEITPYGTGFKTGIKINLSEFENNGRKLELALQLFITLETLQDELVCEVVPLEKGNTVKELLWPKGFVTGKEDFSVVPHMQGMLLPGNWPKEVRLNETSTYSRGLYMPWWGHYRENSAVIAILETPDDAGCTFVHPEGGPTSIAPRWMHTLGRLGYTRKIRFCFLEEGNYVELAKRYRYYAIGTGNFVSLKEKISRTPILGKLIGSPVTTFQILIHIEPESHYFNKENPEKNHSVTSFDMRANQLQQLAAGGIKKLYVHMDGWGCRGYDNLHPDILPPSPDAGGWEGMKRLADTCDSLGYVLALHDQYRDFFYDAPSFDMRHALFREDGKPPFNAYWFGGKQSVLCAKLAPGFIARNHQAIKEMGIKIDGTYLDVFAIVPLEECYNPEHPMTRTECRKFRAQGFHLIRSLEGIVSSEEPVDWAIPYIDLVHHGPHMLDVGLEKGAAVGIPVPLFNLVYHDALLLPWYLQRGAFGIPDTDLSFLYGLLNGGMPYLPIKPNASALERTGIMCALHERVALLEMTGHELLDRNCRRHRSSFSDGTTVTVDFDADTFEISPGLQAD
jgi:Family of unknown function (DUF5696)